MQQRTLILIGSGVVVVVLLGGIGIYLLRNRDVGGGTYQPPTNTSGGSHATSSVDQAALQAERDFIASSTYQERLQVLSPDVQKQVTQPTPRSPNAAPAQPVATSTPTTPTAPAGPDPNADPDNDGLTNLQEEQLGTNPNNPDTDADGFKDGDEVKAGYNPNGPGKLPQ